MSNAPENQSDLSHDERIAKCLEDNPDLTEGLVEKILVGIEELDRGKISEYRFGKYFSH